MARVVRDVLYQDGDGISVVLIHEASADPGDKRELIRKKAERQRLLLRLGEIIQQSEEWVGQLSDTSEPIGSDIAKRGEPSALSHISGPRVYLRVQPGPATQDSSPADVDSFYSVVAGLLAGGSDSISCELIANDTSIAFQVGVAAELRAVIQQQLYAAYPNALIEESDLLPSEARAAIFGMTLSFTPADAVLRISDHLALDPLAGLLDMLGGLEQGETVRWQMVLGSKDVKAPLLSRAAIFVGDTVRERFMPAKESDDDESSKADEAILRASLRVIVQAATATRSKELLNQVVTPFYQWSSPGGAQLKKVPSTKPEQLLRAFRGGQIDKKYSFLITANEAASLYHLPSNPRAFPRLAALSSAHLAPPQQFGTEAGGLRIGDSRYRNQLKPVVIAPQDRLRHLYLIGQTGTGKSTLFQSLFLQDIIAGNGGCYIDPHGETIDWLLARVPKHRVKDVVLFDPSRKEALLGLNLLEWQTPDERDLLVQELILLFYKVFDPDRTGIIGPQFEHWLRCAALTVTDPKVRGTLVDIPRLFTDQKYQRWASARVSHPAARNFWKEQMAQTAGFHKSEMLNYFVSKFGAFLGNETMYQLLNHRQSAFDVRRLMDRRKILLVNLSKGKVGELNAQLLGTLLFAKIQIAALSRADTPPEDRQPFYVYIDEFQTVATDSFASLLSEIRKYGVGLHLTHQYVAQLSPKLKDAIIGNVGTLLALRLGRDDAAWLADYFGPLSADDLTHVAAYHLHCKTLQDGKMSAPFTVQPYRADVAMQPRTEAVIRARMEAVAAFAGLMQLQTQDETNFSKVE